VSAQNRRDAVYGRRGGGWKDTAKPADLDSAPRCDVCDRPMVAGQASRHVGCEPVEPMLDGTLGL
jgi:hypothetical protein